jgi:hypothetical protein
MGPVSACSTLHLVPHGGVERLDGFQKAFSRGLPLLSLADYLTSATIWP